MRIRDPGWRQFGSGIRDRKKSDLGSGIHIPDPQHWFLSKFFKSISRDSLFNSFVCRNTNGGRWIISLDKRQRAEHLDTYWLEILFFLIGEHADQHAHQVSHPEMDEQCGKIECSRQCCGSGSTGSTCFWAS